MDFDIENIKCPKCGCKFKSGDFVGAKYDNGLTRWYNRMEPIVPNPSSWMDYKWVRDHYTNSNVLFLRCACGANVRVKMHMRVEQNKQGEFDE